MNPDWTRGCKRLTLCSCKAMEIRISLRHWTYQTSQESRNFTSVPTSHQVPPNTKRSTEAVFPTSSGQIYQGSDAAPTTSEIAVHKWIKRGPNRCRRPMHYPVTYLQSTWWQCKIHITQPRKDSRKWLTRSTDRSIPYAKGEKKVIISVLTIVIMTGGRTGKGICVRLRRSLRKGKQSGARATPWS